MLCQPDVMYSPSLDAFARVASFFVTADGVVHQTRGSLCLPATPLPDELSEVLSNLWAEGPYDVGLIKGVKPVVITPKSDHRPCHQQYPLRHEAVDGITPVFESLL